MRRRGQAAMEFLLTYGWAILVVLAAVGALAYFGVLNNDARIPDSCLLSDGFTCTDFKFTKSTGAMGESEVLFKIWNNIGEAVTIQKMLMTCEKGCPTVPVDGGLDCGVFFDDPFAGPPVPFPGANQVTLSNGEAVFVGCDIDNAASIDFEGGRRSARVAVEFNYSFTDESVSHTASGEITGHVEE